MANVRINHAPQVAGLQISLLNTMEQIDKALDGGDCRSFRAWSNRYLSITDKIAGLLVKIAIAEDR